MHQSKTYRTTRQRWDRLGHEMHDGDLIRAFLAAHHALDEVCSPSNQARLDAIETEIEHRGCWL